MYFDKYDVCKSINEILKKYNLDILLTESDIEFSKRISRVDRRLKQMLLRYLMIHLILLEQMMAKNSNEAKQLIQNKISGNYFNSMSVNREDDEGVLYHFIKFEHLKDTILNGKIRLSSLSSQTDNDPLEYVDLENIVKPDHFFLFRVAKIYA